MLNTTSNDTPATFGSPAAGAPVPIPVHPLAPEPNPFGLTDCGKTDGPSHYRGGCDCDACEAARESNRAGSRRAREFRRRFPTLWRTIQGATWRNVALQVYDLDHVSRLNRWPWIDRRLWGQAFAGGTPLARSNAERQWARLCRRMREHGFAYAVVSNIADGTGDANRLRFRLKPEARAIARALLLADYDEDEDPPTPVRETPTEAEPVRAVAARLRMLRSGAAERARWESHVRRQIRKAREARSA